MTTTATHKIKNICLKIFATIIIAFFFLSCTFWIDEDIDGLPFLALFYCPWIFFLFCYYAYMLWSKKNVTGERLLLLPVLQKLHLFKDYSSNFDKKKELLKKIADILAEEKWITSAELLVLKEKIEKYGGTL